LVTQCFIDKYDLGNALGALLCMILAIKLNENPISLLFEISAMGSTIWLLVKAIKIMYNRISDTMLEVEDLSIAATCFDL